MFSDGGCFAANFGLPAAGDGKIKMRLDFNDNGDDKGRLLDTS